MKQSVKASIEGLILLAGLLLVFSARTTGSGTPFQYPGQAQKVSVFVSDFQLVASPGSQAGKRLSPGSGEKKPASQVYAEEDTSSIQARQLMDFFANTLVQTLQRDGYVALRQAGKAPERGVLLRGVFAEPDDKNRIRRAILGGGSTGPKLLLYVGTFNLSSPDQPLYLPAAVQEPDSRYGPVITLNAYIPLSKYEVDKNPGVEDVQKICTAISNNLSALLNKNAMAFQQ
jgi:hypothetical protein